MCYLLSCRALWLRGTLGLSAYADWHGRLAAGRLRLPAATGCSSTDREHRLTSERWRFDSFRPDLPSLSFGFLQCSERYLHHHAG